MPSTTNYRPGDLVFVRFPFAGGTQSKPRPALVLLDTGDLDVVVARVTTQVFSTALDVVITDWQAAGLIAPSIVRLHKVATIEKVLIQKTLGHLQPADRQQVAAVLKQMYGNW